MTAPNQNIPQKDGVCVLIDAYNSMYKNFHGTKMLNAPDGTPTNAIFTTLRSLLAIQGRLKDQLRYGVAVFEGKGGSQFRKEIFPEYKAQRKEMPEELRVQIPYILELYDILGWKTIHPEQDEADDVIATLAARSGKVMKTEIHSSDKDFYDMVEGNIVVVDSKAKIIYTREEVYNKLSVYPEQIVDYLTLLGDGVDNIKGIDKCGKTTAAKWLSEYGTLDNIIANADSIKGVVGNNLREAIADGRLELYRKLVQMKKDIPLSIKVTDVRKDPIDQVRFEEFCRKLGFTSFLPENRAEYQAERAAREQAAQNGDATDQESKRKPRP